MVPLIGNDWDQVLESAFKDKQIQDLLRWVDNERDKGIEVYPPKEDMFNALKLTSYENTKVVILGQDPYINPGQAHGLSFSVKPGVPIPPSLMNIFKELHNELGCYIPNNGCLIPWAEQGVLLLNSVLSVERGKSRSHDNIGWERLTDYIIYSLGQKDQSLIFMLWGNYARRKASLIQPNTHLILEAAHPSPLAGGAFFGCNHFIKANEYLYETQPHTIDWQIPNI